MQNVRSIFFRTALIIGVLVFWFAGVPVRAVVLAGGDGTQNTAPPPVDDFGFANVGLVFNTADGFFNSGVYLGHGWVLSAYHPVRTLSGGFQFGPVIFRDPVNGDVTFAVNPSSAVRLKNSDNTPTDLALFQLTTEPTFLPDVALAASTPTPTVFDVPVKMAGAGLNREVGETHWDVNTAPTPDVWTETSGAGDRQGYKWGAAGQALRWGDNTLEANLLPPGYTFTVNGGFGVVTSIKTDFDNLSGQAQGAAGDSGGGVFYKNGARWELLGIMQTIDSFDGQPGSTAVYGNATYAANIPTYRDQILAVIPEPASGLLALGGAVMLGSCRRLGRGPRR